MSAEHDGPDERFERAFTQALGRAGGAYDTDGTRLVDTGWSYGRRLRRRRRVGTAAGAAALALVGVGGAALGGLLPGQGTAVVGAAGGTASSHPSAAPVSGPEFLRMLTELLPQGTVTVGEARGTESGSPQLRLVLDDGHGPVQYLFWIIGGSTDMMGCPAGVPTELPAGQPTADACSASVLPDGTKLTVYQAGTRSGEPEGAKAWSAKLAGDGYLMMLQEWNRKPLEQGTPITRADPPLTLEQLAAVVKDPRWKKVAAAVKDSRAGKPTPGATLPLPSPPEGVLRPALPRPLPGEGAWSGTPSPSAEPMSGPTTLSAFPTPGS
ncbi:hypothetical protein [Kitasatospora sp. NPDC096204]|uniref:hypothetical protein n=1 Tax=Kitasatospora sp. NPDC096204 TaxID=3364094 RepID=UPI00380F8B14